MVDYVDIVNSLSGVSRDQLNELELDILVLSEFAFEVELGGWTKYFDSNSGDDLYRLLDAAKRHSFDQLSLWIEKVASEFPQLVSAEYDTRSVAAREVSESRYRHYDEFNLAEEAIDLWEELTKQNFETLELNYNTRLQ